MIQTLGCWSVRGICLGRRVHRRINDIEGFSQPTWYSPGPKNMSVECSDLELLSELRRRGSMMAHKQSWLSVFLDAPNLLVKKKGSRDWFFAIGQIQSSASAVWPADRVLIPGTQTETFMPAIDRGLCQQLHFVCILDLNEWEGCSYEWRSPMWVWENHPRARPRLREDPAALACVRAVPTNRSGSLLEVAARNVFWSWSLTQLKQVASHIGLKFSTQEPSCFSAALDLTKHILHTGDDEALALLSSRFGWMEPDTNFAEILQLDDAYQLMSMDDEAEFKREQHLQKNKESGANSFQWEWRQAFVDAKTRKCKSEASKQAKLQAALTAYKCPPTPPEGAISQEEARAMTPLGSHIWRDLTRGGWCGHMKPFARCSRRWATDGHRQACLWVLRTLWNQYLVLQGLGPEACPVAGFMAPADGASGSGGPPPPPLVVFSLFRRPGCGAKQAAGHTFHASLVCGRHGLGSMAIQSWGRLVMVGMPARIASQSK